MRKNRELTDIEKKQKKLKKKAKILYFMHLMRIDYNKIKEKNYFKRTPDISLGFLTFFYDLIFFFQLVLFKIPFTAYVCVPNKYRCYGKEGEDALIPQEGD